VTYQMDERAGRIDFDFVEVLAEVPQRLGDDLKLVDVSFDGIENPVIEMDENGNAVDPEEMYEHVMRTKADWFVRPRVLSKVLEAHILDSPVLESPRLETPSP
jgi:hypothetical protein